MMNQIKKPVRVDFLYLDNQTCDRCLRAEENLSQALKEIKAIYDMKDTDVQLNKIHISSKDMAIKEQFLSSPTIRINGRDIQPAILESDCQCCGDICGSSVDCRVWLYQGQEYTEPPVGLIVDAISRELEGQNKPDLFAMATKTAYQLPENLEEFFSNLDRTNQKENNMKPKVAFICVHNSCRSQMAEALAKLNASDVFEAYSAGTETKPEINQDAVRIINQLYGVDMNLTQSSKLIDHIPEVDIVIKMGCNVICPFLPSKHEEDWGLDDPTGLPDDAFIETAKMIEDKVNDLARRIKDGTIEV